jgi:hypothetical protein
MVLARLGLSINCWEKREGLEGNGQENHPPTPFIRSQSFQVWRGRDFSGSASLGNLKVSCTNKEKSKFEIHPS